MNDDLTAVFFEERGLERWPDLCLMVGSVLALAVKRLPDVSSLFKRTGSRNSEL